MTEVVTEGNKDNMITNKDLHKPFYLYQKGVENEDIEARSKLELSYENGEETEKDSEKLSYLQKAAEDGYVEAQYNLALLYENGKGTEKNLERAFYWYQKAAVGGLIEAQNNFALLHYENRN